MVLKLAGTGHGLGSVLFITVKLILVNPIPIARIKSTFFMISLCLKFLIKLIKLIDDFSIALHKQVT
jgi:hypothetical protein